MHTKGWIMLGFFLLVGSLVFAQEEGEEEETPNTRVIMEDTLLLNERATAGTNEPSVNQPDTVVIKSMMGGHSPRKAALFSAVLPGLGQAYNGKYWKIPIIYAGFATLGYFVIYNDDRYNLFRRALIAERNGVGEENPLAGLRNGLYEGTTYLQQAVDNFRRNRDFIIILMAGAYALNIMDAIVDAHLIEFDINPELSLDLQPVAGSSLAYTSHLTPTLPTYGLSLTLNLP